MLVIAIGPPSAIGQWGLHFLHELLKKSIGPCTVIAENRAKILRQVASLDRDSNVLIFLDNPDDAIVRHLPVAPIVGFIEAPAQVASYLHLERGLQWQECLRLTSLVFSSLESLYIRPGTLLVKRAAGIQIEELAKSICLHLRIPIPGGFSGTLEDDLLRYYPLAKETKLPGSTAASEAIYESYRGLLSKKSADVFTWPRELFFDTSPHSPNWQKIDFVGPARILFFGPYLYLPTGLWRANLAFEVNDNRSGNSVVVDVFSDAVLAHGEVTLPEAGNFIVALDFECTESTKPLEFRLRLDRGAIQGSLEVKGVTLNRLSDSTEIHVADRSRDSWGRKDI